MDVEYRQAKREAEVQYPIDRAISRTHTYTANAPAWIHYGFIGAEQQEGGEGDPTPNGDGTGTETPVVQPTPTTEGEPKTFTQEEVNALITRETQKASRGKLDPKEAGFQSKDELKSFLEKMKDKAEADKTQEDKDREQAIKTAVEEARNDVLSKANARLIRSEFIIAAAKAKVAIPMDDAFQVAQTLDEYAPEVDEEKGTVTGFDDDFFKVFRSAKPYVFASQSTPDIGAGASGGGANKDAQREQELRTAYPALGRQMSAAEVSGVRNR